MLPETATKTRPEWGTAREALLVEAANEFAEAGFRGASVSRIAKRARVTQPLINHHFGSKEGLWIAVLDWVFADVQMALDEVLDPSLSTREQLLGVARQAVLLFASRPQLARIVSTETNHPSEAFDHLFKKFLQPIIVLTQSLLERAKQEGVLVLDPRLVHFVIVGAAMEPFSEPELVRRGFDMEPFSEEFIESYVDTICSLVEGAFRDPQ